MVNCSFPQVVTVRITEPISKDDVFTVTIGGVDTSYTALMGDGLSEVASGLLASGRTDIALDAGFDIYDILAVAAVIEAAGGIVTDWDGNAIDLSWRGRVVAAGDPRRHREVLALLAEGA